MDDPTVLVVVGVVTGAGGVRDLAMGGVVAPGGTLNEPLWGRDDPAAFADALAEFGPRPPAPGVGASGN